MARIERVYLIPLQLQDMPEDDTGAENDVAVDQEANVIYQKIGGIWRTIATNAILGEGGEPILGEG